MTEWRQITLRDVGTVQSGFAFKSRDWAEAGVPVVKIQNVRGGRVDLTDCSFVPQAVAASAADRYGLSRGDVLITMSGEIGSVGIVCSDTDILLNQRVGRVRLNETDPVLLRFIGYALQRPELKSLMVNIAYGVAQANISPSLLESLPLQLPPRESQRIIGEVLGTIDDLIENNRRRVEVLEEMARAVYREWFVRFRYPGHENVPLVDSPLGPIPEGWACRRLADVTTLVRGRSYRKSELVEEGGLPFVNLKCMMRGGGFRRDGLKRYNGKFSDSQLVSHGDLVLAVTDLTQGREILARATLVPRLAEPAVISLDVARIVPLVASERLWIFAAIRWSDFPDRVKEYANGSTVLHLSPDHVAAGLMLWPPDDLRTAFVGALASMLGSVDELLDAADQLALIRGLLLPKLVTGQIDVSHLDLDALTELVVP